MDGPNKSKAVRVAKGSYYKCFHDIAASSGSDKVDEYTLIIDVKYPVIGNWHTFYKSDMNVRLADADLFINTSGKVGVGDLDYSAGTLPVDVWHRVAVSAKKGSWFRIYVNGVLLHDTVKNLNKAHFFLYYAGFTLFGDNDGDDAEFDIGELAIYDGTLSAARIKMLGSAGY